MTPAAILNRHLVETDQGRRRAAVLSPPEERGHDKYGRPHSDDILADRIPDYKMADRMPMLDLLKITFLPSQILGRHCL